jgi:hypothetical protein
MSLTQRLFMRTDAIRELLVLKTPRSDWVAEELGRLLDEWHAWRKEVDAIVDQPYDRNTHLEVFADGEENMSKHAILQAKTFTFLDNNISGHGFVHGPDGQHIDRNDLRLKIRVKHRIQNLEELRASLPYAAVPDSFWRDKAKTLISKIAENPYKGAEVLADALKNPFA